jgi:hypothetical protein
MGGLRCKLAGTSPDRTFHTQEFVPCRSILVASIHFRPRARSVSPCDALSVAGVLLPGSWLAGLLICAASSQSTMGGPHHVHRLVAVPGQVLGAY